MKKYRQLMILSLALVMTLAGLGFSVFSAKAEDEWTPGDLSWNLSGGTLTITAADVNAQRNYMNDFDSESPPPWYSVRNRIKKVVLTQGIRNAGECAFWNCPNLESVEMAADSVIAIGTDAFKNCPKLKSVIFSGNLEDIQYCAFENCSSLTSVTLPASLRSISSGAFANCSLSAVQPAADAGSRDFYCYTPAKEEEFYVYHLILPENATQVAGDAFSYNPHLPHEPLPDFIIPADVTEIRQEAFSGIKAAAILVPEGVTAIADGAFANCGSLKYIYLPQSCESFGANCFPAGTFLVTIYANDSLRNYSHTYGNTFLELKDPYSGDG